MQKMILSPRSIFLSGAEFWKKEHPVSQGRLKSLPLPPLQPRAQRGPMKWRPEEKERA